ncbi:four-carbon acid sugar kinase family protein [Autumnicola musiva]|uniref:Four-carbon acid sugar kinase family protein n=1 Tax=Autumnicola musiva TaxID=3075589 RepID=A0ABU3D7W7_9FLAO|nr:four-carbon acid sugar kinase family protein [Zunongwangia sp. F117]MDT0677612.1 four-carbon acid sugar kinase family protein [Zunongwangia sp. F117]
MPWYLLLNMPFDCTSQNRDNQGMIIVIADDFTGAAEIGGIGLRYGYEVNLHTAFSDDLKGDMVIFATNMRAKDESLAMGILEDFLLKVKDLPNSMIFLKLDSVFRGHVKITLQTALKLLEKEQVIFIPANPSLNRTIQKGIYYYHQKPLLDSGFFSKSMEENRTSHVYDLIEKKEHDKIAVASSNESVSQGIVIGNTSTVKEVDDWANTSNNENLLAGGANFFEALIKRIGIKNKNDRHFSKFLGEKRLYICGSAHPNSKHAIQEAARQGAIIHNMPERIFNHLETEKQMQTWTDKIISDIKEHSSVIAAVDRLEFREKDELPDLIEKAFARLVCMVLENLKLEELVIEGGATAFAIMSEINYTKFSPEQEFAPGVIRMRVEEEKGLFITVKPGSYQWQNKIWFS